jgi:mannose-1-phosphate guanylyltransferase
MEKTQKTCVFPVEFAWDDLGDWNALGRLHESKDSNVELAHHLGMDTKDSILFSQNEDEIIVTLGIEDLLVVREGNVTLIAKKERTQEIKQLLKKLAEDPSLQEFL